MPAKDETRDILRMFPYGLYVATALGSDGPHAATVTWVTQASFEPRLVAVGLRKGTGIYITVRATGHFILHVVDANQIDFAKAFFKVSQSSGTEIAGYAYAAGSSGMPVFAAAAAWLECEVVEEACQQGDHALFLARVLDSGLRSPGAAALLLRDTPWRYGG